MNSTLPSASGQPFFGRVGLVTGAGNGLGRSLAIRLAGLGASVIVSDSDLEAATAVAHEIEVSGGHATSLEVDVRDNDQMASAVRIGGFGPVTILCANAGIGAPSGVDTGDEQWMREWDVNVGGAVRAVRHTIPAMVDAGEGHVLLVASGAGLLTNQEAFSYTATKHAVVGLAKWLAARYRPQGVQVSCFCPSGMLTDLFEHGLTSAYRELLRPAAVSPDMAAEIALDALRAGSLISTTDDAVRLQFQAFADDPDGWRDTMSRLIAKVEGGEELESSGR